MMGNRRGVWQELELGFGGGSKFRVTLQLVLNCDEAFTKYALAKHTGLKTSVVKFHLNTLVELGWINVRPFAPIKYQANMENEIVKNIHELLSKTRYTRKRELQITGTPLP